MGVITTAVLGTEDEEEGTSVCIGLGIVCVYCVAMLQTMCGDVGDYV